MKGATNVAQSLCKLFDKDLGEHTMVALFIPWQKQTCHFISKSQILKNKSPCFLHINYCEFTRFVLLLWYCSCEARGYSSWGNCAKICYGYMSLKLLGKLMLYDACSNNCHDLNIVLCYYWHFTPSWSCKGIYYVFILCYILFKTFRYIPAQNQLKSVENLDGLFQGGKHQFYAFFYFVSLCLNFFAVCFGWCISVFSSATHMKCISL